MNYCSKCKADLSKGGQQWSRIGNDYYCVGCLKCSFCQKGLTNEYCSSPSKPGIITCKECLPELHKPAGYDPNAKATCKCGKKSEPAWRWNASKNSWECLFRILDADCCSMLIDKCKCGAEKNKGELSCSKCIERERERERPESEQTWLFQQIWERKLL
jgi:hypothetical protein